MNIETEAKKFKAQYDDEDWAELMNDSEFKKAWESNSLVKAGELAQEITIGRARTRKEARQQRERHRIMKRYR